MEGTGRGVDRAGLAIAGGLLLLAVVVFWDATSLPSSTYGVGPRAVPTLIACGLALLAVGNALLAWRGDFPEREDFDARALLIILGGLAALIAIIGLNGGFIPATAILFAATSTAFGRRAVLIDLAIGFALSIVVYLLFAKVLTLSLPMGPIERLF